MDEWNRYPTQEPEDQSGQEPASQPTQPQPSPYHTSYNWQQSNYGQSPYQPPRPPKKKGNGAIVAVSVICAVVIVVLSVLLVLAYHGNEPADKGETTAPTGNSQQANAPKLEITELDEATQGLTTTEIVNRNLDSTVLLTIYQTTTTANNGFPFGQSGVEKEVQAGSASGIVLSADGYIITNWHCVIDEDTNEPFSRVDVTLYDGTVYEDAEVIGADSSTDLAVIKVDATDLQPAEFGDSTSLRLGDRVVALGNAGGLGWSATQGIVSGLARDVYEDTGYAIKCLQVDAAINPGNSGGPLFNAAGQVVAVNSAKIVAEGYEGLGFAIPMNEAKAVIDDLLANGYVTGRVSLGIKGQTYTDAYYQGFLIYSIDEESPLRQTEAKKGDLITAVNGKEVTSYATLRSALAENSVGDTVTLTLLRSSGRTVDTLEVTVKLMEAKN